MNKQCMKCGEHYERQLKESQNFDRLYSDLISKLNVLFHDSGYNSDDISFMQKAIENAYSIIDTKNEYATRLFLERLNLLKNI